MHFRSFSPRWSHSCSQVVLCSDCSVDFGVLFNGYIYFSFSVWYFRLVFSPRCLVSSFFSHLLNDLLSMFCISYLPHTCMFDLVFLLPDDGARKTIQLKILALHLQQVPLGIISLDQAGFMLARYSIHNTRRLLNILNMPSSTIPEVVVSLDAEKAFDQVESGFLCSEGVLPQRSTRKLSLYADDLVLYISNSPTNLFPVILDILKQFGQWSGYKLNFGKSELFPINNLVRKLPKNVATFRWVDQGFKYLGIFITGSLTDTFRSNFVLLLKRVEEDLHRWSTLLLSLAGRINLSQFLHLFPHIPVLTSKKFFCQCGEDVFTVSLGHVRKNIIYISINRWGVRPPQFRTLLRAS